jgi:hypothetical protein
MRFGVAGFYLSFQIGGAAMKSRALLAGEKTVFVRSYLRHRFGSWETVCAHFRRPPR